MKYYIHFSPVFFKVSKKLSGYEVFVSTSDTDTREMHSVLAVESTNDMEFSRISHMLSVNYDHVDNVSFIDMHPIKMVNHVRGLPEKPKRTTNWEDQIDNWSLDLKGNRV